MFLVKRGVVVRRTRFSEWLIRKHWTSRYFADRLARELGQDGFSTNTIDGWRSGKAKPRDHTMLAIKRVSEGELTADDFLIDKGERDESGDSQGPADT